MKQIFNENSYRKAKCYCLQSTYADGRRSKFLVQETRMRIVVQDICPCVISSRASFFLVQETWID